MISPHVSSCFIMFHHVSSCLIMFLDEAHEFTTRSCHQGTFQTFRRDQLQVPSRPAGLPFFPATLLHVTVQTRQFLLGSISVTPFQLQMTSSWGLSHIFNGKKNTSVYICHIHFSHFSHELCEKLPTPPLPTRRSQVESALPISPQLGPQGDRCFYGGKTAEIPGTQNMP